MSSVAESVHYPPPPTNCPETLAKATPQYRLHAWMAMMGLLCFGMIYNALAGWFTWSAYRLFSDGFGPNGDFFDFFRGLCSGFLAVFMIKGLFFKKGGGDTKDFEVTKETQPRLFAFINKLADETGAPRPAKVFLSPHVNACVFYNVTIWNPIFPSKKNLEIGLGLVNVLTLSELKAVLAHEFGHFAQGTMAVGRWVYMAQQVATQLIFHRDALDGFLQGLSRIDIRIAWIGWLLRLVVWSIRSILDTALSGVMLAHRALSREMEFQADLVAVKSAGSDALVHGLFRLPAADQAWEETKAFVGEELNDGHQTKDVFAVQSRILKHQQQILNDPEFGDVPELPDSGREQHRIFTPELAQPPQMWATHPQNHLRENNAKKTYVQAQLVDQSAWVIFDDPQGLREQLSSHLLAEFEKKVREPEETMATLDNSYDKECFKPQYRGVYLGRSAVAHAAHPNELFHNGEIGSLEELYPEWLVRTLEVHRNLEKEEGLLKALRDRLYEPADGVIRFRGKVIKRSQIKEALNKVRADLVLFDTELKNHDIKCRSHHYRIANSFSNEWGMYHHYLVRILHYAEHYLRDLTDANRLLENTFSVVIADGHISNRELVRLLGDAGGLYKTLSGIYNDRDKLRPDGFLMQRMKKNSWTEVLEPLRLPYPTQENVGEWFDAMGGWAGGAADALTELRGAALEQLLYTEEMLAGHYRAGTQPPPPPPPGVVPEGYPTLLPGQERALQMKLGWWDSFQTASGIIPGTIRALVALAIVGGTIWMTVPKAWWGGE